MAAPEPTIRVLNLDKVLSFRFVNWPTTRCTGPKCRRPHTSCPHPPIDDLKLYGAAGAVTRDAVTRGLWPPRGPVVLLDLLELARHLIDLALAIPAPLRQRALGTFLHARRLGVARLAR